MIEALKDTEVLNKVGGRFKLSSLIQKRMLEMMEGSRPLIENTEGMTTIEIVVEEIRQGKIALDLGSPAKAEKKFTL
ncbi:DNA-directed RNA polymerase subunit omega [Anaerohalosphaeraceae bacterium U12dextr]|jgi:DNA-directed RNA polymerase subunit omega